MRDTYAKREYLCKCGTISEYYVWQSLIEATKVKCKNCGKYLDIKNLKVKTQLTSIRTDTKNR